MSKTDWTNICNRVDTCALTGAAAFASGIKGVEVLVNGPLWCFFYAYRYLERATLRPAANFHGSQPDNNAVVYGSEKYIQEAVQRLLSDGRKPTCLFVENSCTMSLIGDDLDGIIRKMELAIPAVTMDCGGLLGGFAEGYCKAGLSFLKKFAKEKLPVQSRTVNLLGLTPYYYNGKADTEEIVRLLVKAGYKVNVVLASGCTLEEMARISQASLNIVCHEELGLALATYLESSFGTPFICAGLPYGCTGTIEWLQRINAVEPCENLAAVEEEAEALQQQLITAINDISINWGNAWFDEVLVAAPGTVALCMAQALRSEWVDMGKLTVLCQHAVDNKYCDVADKVLIAGKDGEEIADYLQQVDNVLVLGSSSENSVLLRRDKCSFYSCNIACPVNDELLLTNTPFMGICGSAYMFQRIINIYMSRHFYK